MPINNEDFHTSLYDLLRTKGYDPIPLDSKGNTTPFYPEADIFKFSFVKNGKKYGDVWATVDNALKLVLYYDDAISSSPDDNTSGTPYGDSWTALIKHLKKWAQRRQLSFELKNKDHLVSDMAQREYMKKKERLGEGYYSMGKKASYNDAIPQVKIVIQHTKQIGEGEQRFRNVDRIFVENTDGERFAVPTKKPGLAKVYARHVAEGGTPYDDRGRHLTTLIEEYNKMVGFVRATKTGEFNESVQRVVNAGVDHYQSLRESLGKLTSHRGYHSYFDSWSPVLNEEQSDITEISTLFTKSNLDPRIESCIPILSKLTKLDEIKPVRELDSWADEVIRETTSIDLSREGSTSVMPRAGKNTRTSREKDRERAKALSHYSKELAADHYGKELNKSEQGVAEGYWADAVKKAEADREARKGKPFEKNPASHDKDGVYIGDKDLAGNPVSKRKEPGVAEDSDTLSGTPVVSLRDFTSQDYTTKRGKTVPKKLKKGDPRVKFHKDTKSDNQGMSEGYFSDLDVRNKDRQYAGTKAYHDKKKAETEKNSADAKALRKQGAMKGQLDELFEPSTTYYTLSNGKMVQVNYKPGVDGQRPAPLTDVKVSYVNPALKPQGPSFNSTGQPERWDRAPDGVKQAIQKFVTQPQQDMAEGIITEDPLLIQNLVKKLYSFFSSKNLPVKVKTDWDPNTLAEAEINRTGTDRNLRGGNVPIRILTPKAGNIIAVKFNRKVVENILRSLGKLASSPDSGPAKAAVEALLNQYVSEIKKFIPDTMEVGFQNLDNYDDYTLLIRMKTTKKGGYAQPGTQKPAAPATAAPANPAAAPANPAAAPQPISEDFKNDLKKVFGMVGLAGAIGYGAWLNHLATYDTPMVHEIVRQAQAGDKRAIEDLRNISLRDKSTVEMDRLLNRYGFRSEYERRSPEDTHEGLNAQQKKAGQLGPTEKARNISPVLGSPQHKHPFNGKLVGNESTDLGRLQTLIKHIR